MLSYHSLLFLSLQNGESISLHSRQENIISHLRRLYVRQYAALLVILSVVLPLDLHAQGPQYKEGDLLVQLQANANPEALAADFSGIQLRPVKLLTARMNIWLFAYDPQRSSADAALSAVRSHEAVRIAQFNHYITRRSVIPNDPQFGSQWGLHNTGQSGGVPDADIDAPEAWDISTGGLTSQGDSIVVAVIDGGFDLNHQDLAFTRNYNEIPGNGIDDDANGYIDDYFGWNAYTSTGNIPSDSHGTHVAGTAAARGNNAIGVTGVNWGAKVLPIAGSSGTESIVVEAYGYVLEMRARYNATNGAQGMFVVSTNSSFGVDFGQPANFPIWCAMYDSMGAVGILSCAATANLNIDIDVQGDVPTACPSDWLVSVTNTTNADLKNSGAAYGRTTIDLGSPGTSILSTTPGNNYGNSTGTSMATPHVAGVIALMYSAANTALIQQYKANPAATALLFKQWLLDGTDSIPSLQNITVSGGRLNAHKSLLLVQGFADPIDPNPPTNVSAYSDYTTPTSIQLRWSNPTTLVNGQPIGSFVMRVVRDGVQITERPSTDSVYNDTGLTDGVRYVYTLLTRLTGNDSLSPGVEVSWVAGGAKTPRGPTTLTVSGTSTSGYTIRWSNPSRQTDNTPLDDLAGIRVYRDGALALTLVRTVADTGRVDSTLDMPPAGLHTYYVTAIDNEIPVNESAASNTGFTPLEMPFSDTFPSSGVPNTAVWQATNVTVDDRGVNEPSPPYAMNLNGSPVGNGDRVEVLPLDLSSSQGSGVVLAYWYQPRGLGDNPEIADSLIVEFRNSLGQWILARRYPGLNSSDPTPPFAFETISVDGVSGGSGTFFYNGFQFRFRSNGTAGAFDDWFVDDVFFGTPTGNPAMVVSPQQVSDTLLVGTVDTTSYLFTIQNTNLFAAPLNYTISKNPLASWLDVTPSSGSVGANGMQAIRLEVDFTGVTAGTYSTAVVVTGNDSTNIRDTVQVSFVVNNAPVVSASPDSFFYALSAGDSILGSLTVRNTGLGPLTYSSAVQGGFAGQTQDNVGSTQNNLTTTSTLMRGGVVNVTTTVQLVEIKSWLTITTSRELRFVVYENTLPTGSFTKIFESTLASSGTGTQFYSSGPVNIMLQSGKYYAIGVNWNGGLNYFWQSAAPVPVPVSFGTITGGLAQTVFPPPATITQNALTSLYYTQLVTASGRWLTIESGGAGMVAPGDSALLGFKVQTALLGSGVSNAALLISNNDPISGMLTVPVVVDVLSSAADLPTGLPEQYALSQNYPNPFNPQTRIQFALPQASQVRITLYNILGQEVVTLVNGEMPAGYHASTWDGRNAAGGKVGSGVYFYRIEATGTANGELFTDLKKMILVK
jgi:subtilisin family serine protease